jgi:hypothetical protein
MLEEALFSIMDKAPTPPLGAGAIPLCLRVLRLSTRQRSLCRRLDHKNARAVAWHRASR